MSSEGISYDKNAVIEYLKQNSLPFTQEYIDMAAKMFKSNDGVVVSETKTINEYHSEVDEIGEDEFDEYIKVKELEMLSKIVSNSSNMNFMSYAVESISDKIDGSTDTNALKRCLIEYANKGWRVKTIFTNEIGKDAVSYGSVGVNSTIDQVVIVFERPMFLTDSKAKEYIDKLKSMM